MNTHFQVYQRAVSAEGTLLCIDNPRTPEPQKAEQDQRVIIEECGSSHPPKKS